MSNPRTGPPDDPSSLPLRAPTCSYEIRVEEGCHRRYPEGLLQARLSQQPVSFTLQGKWSLLGEAPQGHRAVDREGIQQ